MPTAPAVAPPRRSARFEDEPGYYEPAGLWLYGNVRLLGARLCHLAAACAEPYPPPAHLDAIERLAEDLVLEGKILVCGMHNAAHKRAAIVPLRWGSPRIVVFSGGIRYHLGPRLTEEPFREGKLWRYAWDPKTDLAVSRRAPDKLPTFSHYNPTVDRLVAKIGEGERVGLLSPFVADAPYLG